MRFLWASLCVLLLAGCNSTKDLTVVTSFEPDRYMGVWYETARLPNRFEKGMSNVTATYSLNGDGSIKVINKGYIDKKEQWKQAEGHARPKGEASQGLLKVSFFKPFYGSYKVIDLDDDYTKAIVTSGSYNYLWFLSREPNISEEELQLMVDRARELGFDTRKLEFIDQSRNIK